MSRTSPRASPVAPAPPALLLLPAVLVTAFTVLGGLGAVLGQSLGLLPVVGPARLSLAAFGAAGAELAPAVGASLLIGCASTAIALVVGFLAAAVVLQGRRTGRLVAALGAATVPIPHLVGAVAVGLLLADGGLLARWAGVPGDRWPDLVGGPGWIATVLEFGWKESAFVALVVVGALAGTAAGHLETAAGLGAGAGRRLTSVLLPLARPALTASGAIVLVYTLGSYEVPWLLGRAYPEPLPVLAVRLSGGISLTSRPAAAAVAVLTLAIGGVAVLTALGVLRIAAAVRR